MANDTDRLHDLELDYSDLQRVVSHLADIARTDIAPEQLADKILDQAIGLLAAIGGSFWLEEQRGVLRLLKRMGPAPSDEDSTEFQRRLRNHVFNTGSTQIGQFPGNRFSEPSTSSIALMLFVSPIRKAGRVAGVLEIIQRREIDEDAIRGHVRFLEMMCQTSSDYFERCEYRSSLAESAFAQQLVVLSQKLQQSLEIRSFAFDFTNECRRLVGCDRVSLAVKYYNGYRLLAMSGVDAIDRRSNAIKRMEPLINAVARTGAPLWYQGDEQSLPPQLSHPLESYLNESHVRGCGILPLLLPITSGNKHSVAFAAVVFEQFRGVVSDKLRKDAHSVVNVGRPSLLNVLRYQALPTLPFLRHHDGLIRRSTFRSLRFWSMLAGACVMTLLLFWPAEFAVNVRGELQPQNRQEAFAPMDGEVTRILVRHGDRVVAGTPLVELKSPQLDVEQQQLKGDYDTSCKRMSVIQSSLLQVGNARERSADRIAQLSAEQEELLVVLKSQRAQLALISAERERLVVRSPMNGEVLTWDVEKLLKNRPVERGQSLLSVGELSGPWIAQVMIPDDHIGYLMEAQQLAKGPLKATFQLATDRRSILLGEVRTMSNRTEASDEQRAIVKAIVDFDASDASGLRPGSTIFARIKCGSKPLGYVWFHELIELVRGWKFYWVG